MDVHFEIPKAAASNAKLNPMLYLPSFHQLVGAVFVESVPAVKTGSSDDLTPSMDREGFVDNNTFKELRELVRTGLEMLAYVDHREQRKAERKKTKSGSANARQDFKSAVQYIESVPGLKRADRTAVIEQFQELSTELEDAEEYYRVGTAKLELMGLLGVMAGFVTHEMQRILHGLEELLQKVERLARKDSSIGQVRHEIQTAPDCERTGSTIQRHLLVRSTTHTSPRCILGTRRGANGR